MSRGLVPVDQAFGHGLIDAGDSGFVSRLGGSLVTRLDGRIHFLEGRPHGRALGGVTQAVFLGLTGTFAC